MLGRQEEIKPLGKPGQYDSFPSTSLLVPFLMTMNYPLESVFNKKGFAISKKDMFLFIFKYAPFKMARILKVT